MKMFKFLKADLASELQNLITKYPMNEERDEFPNSVSFIYDNKTAQDAQIEQQFTSLANKYGFEVSTGTSIFNPDKISFSLYFDSNVMTLQNIKIEKQALSYRDNDHTTFFCSVDNIFKGGRYNIYDIYIVKDELTNAEKAALITTVKQLKNAVLQQMYDRTAIRHLSYYINANIDKKALMKFNINIK